MFGCLRDSLKSSMHLLTLLYKCHWHALGPMSNSATTSPLPALDHHRPTILWRHALLGCWWSFNHPMPIHQSPQTVTQNIWNGFNLYCNSWHFCFSSTQRITTCVFPFLIDLYPGHRYTSLLPACHLISFPPNTQYSDLAVATTSSVQGD
jgi:hypothetical protein